MKRNVAWLLVALMMVTVTLSTASAFTPPGLEKKGGLPPGIMKRLISEALTYETIIEDINAEQRRITIKDGTAIISLLVAANAKIEVDGGKNRDFSHLRKGQEVILKLDKDKTITDIIATTVDKKDILEGTITAINTNRNRITINTNNQNRVIEVSSRAVIREGNVTKRFSDLKVNMKIRVEMKDNKAVTIDIISHENVKISGTIEGINTSRNEVIIKTDGLFAIYSTDKNSKIYVNNQVKALKDLTIGMLVEAYVNDFKIITLHATTTNYVEIEALVHNVDVTNREIRIIYDNKHEIYKVKADAPIIISNQRKTLSDIEVGMKIKVKLQGSEIVEVIVINDTISYEGRLVALHLGTRPAIVLEISNERKTFNLANVYTISNPLIDLLGKNIRVTLKENLVIDIHSIQ